jgi:hypothetical protein
LTGIFSSAYAGRAPFIYSLKKGHVEARDDKNYIIAEEEVRILIEANPITENR